MRASSSDHLERLDEVVVGAELQADDRSTTWPRAVSIRIGVWMPRWRSVRHTSKPLPPGSMTSSRMASNDPGAAAREAADGVAFALDLIAFGHEPIGERHDEAGFVLDQEHTSTMTASVTVM